MRIGIDYRPAQKINSKDRGVGRYTRELTRHLAEGGDEHQFVLFTLGGRSVELDGDFESRAIFYLPRPSRLNWLVEALLFPGAIRDERLELFHVTELTSMPSRSSCPVWLTLHDLIPWVFWEETVRRTPRDFIYALERGLRLASEADLILTDSEHSRSDICARLGLPSSRVEVVYLGCDETLAPVDRGLAQGLVQEDGIDDRFLLYLGGSDYRKNLPVLLEAFARIVSLGYPGTLLLGGGTFNRSIPEVEELTRLAGRLGVAGQVRFYGFIPDQRLASFLSACDYFIFPSLYEGFGLPVLEAMKCGAPLLCSRASALPEVAGEAAFYFDPSSVEGIVEAYRQAEGSPDLVETKRRTGLERARSFTWRAMAERILTLYRERFGRGGSI